MAKSDSLADHQLQRLLRAGLATHVINPVAADLMTEPVQSQLREAGADCIVILADGRIAFSALKPLPDSLRDAAHPISEQQSPVPEQTISGNFHSRRGTDPAVILVDQLATCLTQISKGQALINRLTYRCHVMELALSQQAAPESAQTQMAENIAALAARVDMLHAQLANLVERPAQVVSASSSDINALLAPLIDDFASRLDQSLARPAPQLDMSPLHAAAASQTAATATILKRLENLCATITDGRQTGFYPALADELKAFITEFVPSESRELSAALIDRFDEVSTELSQLQAQVASLPAAVTQSGFQRESFARFGVALQEVINRVEILANNSTTATDLTEMQGTLDAILARLDSKDTPPDPQITDLAPRVEALASGLSATEATMSSLPFSMVAPTLQRESFARFGTALNTAITRLEAVSDRLDATSRTEIDASQHETQDGLAEFLSDLRFATAELVAASLKDQAKAS